MAAPLRLKVPVSTLIEKIEARKAEIEAEYSAKLAELPLRHAAFNEAVTAALMAASNRTRVGDYTDIDVDSIWRRDRQVIEVQVTVPGWKPEDRPRKLPERPNYGSIEKDLGLLRATSEAFITISTESNLAQYL